MSFEHPDLPIVDPGESEPVPSRIGPSPVELGSRIKLLRIARGLTLKDLEQRGGISATHISEIERGRASPTVGALARVATALGVRPATLIEPRTVAHVTVTRADERSRHRVQWNGASLEPVAGPVQSSSLGSHVMTLPIAPVPALTHRHEGEEWATVLSGAAEIRIEDETHVLREGDSLHFRATRPHSYSNASSSPAVLLSVCRPRLAL